MNRIIIIFCIFLTAYNSAAQNKQQDSLENVLENTVKPIEKFKVLYGFLETSMIRGSSMDSSAFIKLHQLAQQSNNDSLLAISYNVIGIYLSTEKSDYSTAMEYLFKAIPLAKKSNDKRRLSSIYFDIALIYGNMQNPEEAIKYTRKGGENLPDKVSPLYDYMLAQYLTGLSSYYIIKSQPDSALHYALALVECSRRSRSTIYESISLFQTGMAYAMFGDTEMTEIYFKKGKLLLDSITIPIGVLFIDKIYLPYLLRHNKYSELRENSWRLLHLGQKINNNEVQLTGAEFLRKVYDEIHQTDSAYYYSKMQLSLEESISNQNNINKVEALAFAEKIRLIEEESKLAGEAHQRRQNIQFAIIAFGIISFFILFLLLSRRIITNSRLIEFLGVIALLIVFEFINLLLHPVLEKFTNHSPLIMLLILVCIAALLVPIHHRLEKWAKHILVEKNKKIRLAAAKRTIEKLEKGNNHNN